MNWKRLFATHILERGYDYYLENRSVRTLIGVGIMLLENGQSDIWNC